MHNVQIIKVTCIENGKTVDAELFDVKPNKITVILPGFQKLTLDRDPNRPALYLAKQFGLEFYANYRPH